MARRIFDPDSRIVIQVADGRGWRELPAMEKEFAARRGYPLRRWLPALAGWVVDDR